MKEIHTFFRCSKLCRDAPILAMFKQCNTLKTVASVKAYLRGEGKISLSSGPHRLSGAGRNFPFGPPRHKPISPWQYIPICKFLFGHLFHFGDDGSFIFALIRTIIKRY